MRFANTVKLKIQSKLSIFCKQQQNCKNIPPVSIFYAFCWKFPSWRAKQRFLSIIWSIDHGQSSSAWARLAKRQSLHGGGSGWLVVRQLKCLIAAANVEKTVITVIHCRCPIVSSVLTDDGRQRHPTRVCSQPNLFFAANKANFSKNLFLKKPFLQPTSLFLQPTNQFFSNFATKT